MSSNRYESGVPLPLDSERSRKAHQYCHGRLEQTTTDNYFYQFDLLVCSLFCLLFLLFSPFLSDSSNASISTRLVINFVNMWANSVENRNRMVYSPTLKFNSNFNLHALTLVFINSKRRIVKIKKYYLHL